jgi:murein DD-endopeptidase MepM/ murein hydrolase activator NlpD
MASHTITHPRNRLPCPIDKKDVRRVFDNFGDLRYVEGKGWYAHPGIDISCRAGTKLYLPVKSKVIAKKMNHRTWGNRLDFEIIGGAFNGYHYAFSHCLKPSDYFIGKVLPKGVVVALTGNTGNTTGPHLDLMYGTNLGPNGYFLRSEDATTRGFIDATSVFDFLGCRWG